jgi:hypothetical protein
VREVQGVCERDVFLVKNCCMCSGVAKTVFGFFLVKAIVESISEQGNWRAQDQNYIAVLKRYCKERLLIQSISEDEPRIELRI